MTMRLAKNTTYLLPGKSIGTSQIKSATECQVEVFSLWQLKKLLLSQFMVKTMQQLDWLTRDLFKGTSYKAAESSTPATAEAKDQLWTRASTNVMQLCIDIVSVHLAFWLRLDLL